MSTLLSAKSFALQLYRTGSPIDHLGQVEPLVCLAGGGSDDSWAEGWRELLQHANSGDVVIVRADGARGGYEPWIYQDEGQHHFPKVNSVTTLVLESAQDANRPEVADVIRRAELIFFAGGDQSYYIRWIQNSRLLQEISLAVFRRGVAIGGTSAGMAILGGIDYAARYGSPRGPQENLTSDEVLQDPLSRFVDLSTNVLTLPFLQPVVTDTHFSERGREGRLVGFLAKASIQHLQGGDWAHLRGIGIDEGTAFCYGRKGLGQSFGVGAVYFLRARVPAERVVPGQPLVWYGQGHALAIEKQTAEDPRTYFDLRRWAGVFTEHESWWVDARGLLHKVKLRIP